MDVYSFLNSSDVADYLRYKEYEFNAAEVAYIVYHSDTLTLDEKIAAWQEIVDTMPDCPLCSSAYDPYFESAHNSELQFLKDLIFVEKIKLKRFMDSEGCYYVPSLSRYALEGALKYGRGEHLPWRNAVVNVFSSFDKCVDSLRCHDEERSLYDRYTLSKSVRLTQMAIMTGAERLPLTASFEC